MTTAKGHPVAERVKGAYKPTTRTIKRVHALLVGLGQAPNRPLTEAQPLGPSGAPSLGVARAMAYAMAYQTAEQHNQTANIVLAALGYVADRPATSLHPCWHPGLAAVWHYHVTKHPDWGRVHVGKRQTAGPGVLTAYCKQHGHKQAACNADCKVTAYAHHLGVALADYEANEAVPSVGAAKQAKQAKAAAKQAVQAEAKQARAEAKQAKQAKRVRRAAKQAVQADNEAEAEAIQAEADLADLAAADEAALSALAEAGL